MSNLARGLVGGAALLGVAGGSLGLYAVSAPEHAPTELVVDDLAEVLHEPTLRDAVEEITFHEPTTVAVFTERGGPQARTNVLALNDAVLAHAREDRPEWLSADGQKWADGLFILGVDPEGRLVGTYFGEDRKVDQEEQEQIQEATKDSFRARQWTVGAIEGVEEAAERINAPFARTTGGGLVLGGASLATLIGGGTALGIGLGRAGRCRAARSEGDERMAAVVRDMDETELHARLIPASSRYGGRVLRRFDDYRAGFRELTELGNRARAVREKDYDTKAAETTLTAYRDKARAVDQLDDVISDTATFLTRENGWEQAWERQVDPLRTDLGLVEKLLTEDLPKDLRGLTQGQKLREFASAAEARLDEMRGDVEHGRLSPDDALDELRRLHDSLTGHLDTLAADVADVGGETDEARSTLRGSVRSALTERRGVDHSPTILSTSDPNWVWYSVGSFRTGYQEGAAQIASSSSSSGGSSSGYSSSSFSGAGSSSRF